MIRRWLSSTLLALLLVACGGSGLPAYTSDQAIEAFRAAGLPAEDPQVMGTDDYGIGPKVGQGKVMKLTGLCEKCNARVIAFDNTDDLQKLKAYYDGLGKNSAKLASHTFVHGNLLLQMSASSIDDATAAKFKAAMETVK